MKKLRIVFFGTPDFVVPVMETLYENFTLVGVVTSPPQPVGRQKAITSSPVASKIDQAKWPLIRLQPHQLDQGVVEKLGELQPDLFVVAAYGKIIPQSILDVAQYGSINIHPSKLPQYRGPSPIQQAILNGDGNSAITYILMDEKMDHGPILLQEHFELSPQDNFHILSHKMFLKSSFSIPEIIKEFISKSIQPQPQDHSQATYCKMIKKEDGFIDINNPPPGEKLEEMIRAYYPWPTVWTRWDGKVVKLYPENRIQIEGKNIMSTKEFLNGYPNFPLKDFLKL
jgi:methionyl-tRNA formyltransferase